MLSNILMANVKSMLKQRKPRQRSRKKLYNHPKRLSMAARLLDAIEASGGMTRKQIYKWIWDNGSYPNEKHPVFTSKTRPWQTNLNGGSRHAGLLYTFCFRDKGDSRWKRNKIDHKGKPYAVLRADHRAKNTWTNTWTNTTQYGSHIMTFTPSLVAITGVI